jgi:glycerol-3-phosphate dehydrogenase (NAD(P)+)
MTRKAGGDVQTPSRQEAPSVVAGVVGAGSWGTALALLLHRNGHRVRLWTFDADVVQEVAEHGENRSYLSGIPLPESLKVSTDLEEVVNGAELVVSVSPSQFVGRVMAEAAPHLVPDALVVSASKGIEIATLRRMDQVLSPLLPESARRQLCVLSGPSFAVEVARELPTAVVVASRDRDARLRAQALFGSNTFRVYTNPDVVGVELGGAVKNVIALAAGVASGLGFGHNTLAALITRGLAEITRLGLALGADQATFFGLAGMGDLVLTCTADLSRNRTVGFRLGRGERLEDILGDMKAVAEGVRTTAAVHELAESLGVEMPITNQVFRILEEEVDPREAVHELMMRDPKPEGVAS